MTELESQVAALAAPREGGRVALVVQRLAGGKRATPSAIVLDPVGGVIGDRWSQSVLPPNPDAMVTLMRWDVAELLARRAGVPVEVLGDNVFADVDTSAANLPPGTMLRVGATTCVVTPKPHRGCSKFSARVGADAWALTRAPAWVDAQLRGVHLRVLEGGRVAVGDAVSVVSRPLSA